MASCLRCERAEGGDMWVWSSIHGTCDECRQAKLVVAVWQVVLWYFAPGYGSANIVGLVLGFCRSPTFEDRVCRMEAFLHGAPFTPSPFIRIDREFNQVLNQRLSRPRPGRSGVFLSEMYVSEMYAYPGYRRCSHYTQFSLTRHIVGFIAPRMPSTFARCMCTGLQRVGDVEYIRRCAHCANAWVLRMCLEKASGGIRRDILPVLGRPRPPLMAAWLAAEIPLVPEGRGWEHW